MADVDLPVGVDAWREAFATLSDHSALKLFFHLTFAVARDGDVSPVDELLENIEPASIGIMLSSGMLRGSWRLAVHLPHWRSFRDKTKEFIIADGQEDYNKVLRGLLDDSKFYIDHFGMDQFLYQSHPSLKAPTK